jgi:hypothetical protein
MVLLFHRLGKCRHLNLNRGHVYESFSRFQEPSLRHQEGTINRSECRLPTTRIIRSFSVDTSTSTAFDRELKKKQRNNAAGAHKVWKDGEDVVDYNYFRREMAYRLVDRLDDIKREEGFPLALDIGM